MTIRRRKRNDELGTIGLQVAEDSHGRHWLGVYNPGPGSRHKIAHLVKSRTEIERLFRACDISEANYHKVLKEIGGVYP